MKYIQKVARATTSYFSDIYYCVKHYPYETLVISLVIFLLVYAIYLRLFGIKGTWSKNWRAELSYVRSRLMEKENGGGHARHQRYVSPNLSLPQQTPPHKSNNGKESAGEQECRRVLENIYKRPFNKIRPGFLRNYITERSNLEIDCYNDDLKLGVEYNGIQHYQYTPYFHTTKDAFYNQKYRDDMKKRLCKEQGVVLIEVPYTVRVHDIEPYLVRELRRANMF